MSTVAAPTPQLLEAVPKRLLVGGAWRDAAGGLTFEVEDPATGEVLCAVADGGVEDAGAALDAAAAAQSGWATSAPRERGEILRRAFELMQERSEDLARLATLEMGKPLAEARQEVAYAAEFFRWFGEEAVRIHGRYSASPNGRGRLLTLKAPVGPCLLITPWNFPLAMGTRKIGPAVAAGCTMVVKPARQTPLCTLALAALLEEAGLPPGVLNLVLSSSSGATMAPLIADPRLRKLSFTGSTEVGRLLLAQAAPGVLRVSMELGGNAPFLVFADADVDAALEGALQAKMRNGGEACTAANRFLVHESVADAFAAGLAVRMSGLRVGHGIEAGVEVGPLIDAAQRDKVGALVADAVERGANVLTGGEALAGAGYFFSPTVLSEVPPQAQLLREEIFGPVAPITTFAEEEEAVAAANATEYGLAAYAYTRDLGRVLRLLEALESGMIGINQGLVSNPAAPFGGVKQSGLGREGGAEGIDEFLETKYAAIDL